MRIILYIIMLFCLSCNLRQSFLNYNELNSTLYDKIKLDEEHNHSSFKTNEIVSKYSIREDSGIIIDATEYKYNIPLEFKKNQINQIQVVIDGNVFYSEWNGENMIVLDKKTISRLKSEVEFTGFKKGQLILIAIGISNESKLKLNVIYATMINVI
jgi:hypothetical protein